MKMKLLAILLLAGTSMFARTHVSIGFGIGFGGFYPGYPVYGYYYAPPPPPVYYAPAPIYPGPGYVWVGGYYYPAGPRWFWRPGYWARPPFGGARWVAPYYVRGRYYNGYWRR